MGAVCPPHRTLAETNPGKPVLNCRLGGDCLGDVEFLSGECSTKGGCSARRLAATSSESESFVCFRVVPMMKITVFDIRKANMRKSFVLFLIDALDFADCRELPIVCMSYVSTALCLLGSSVAPLARTTSDFVANYPRRQC